MGRDVMGSSSPTWFNRQATISIHILRRDLPCSQSSKFDSFYGTMTLVFGLEKVRIPNLFIFVFLEGGWAVGRPFIDLATLLIYNESSDVTRTHAHSRNTFHCACVHFLRQSLIGWSDRPVPLPRHCVDWLLIAYQVGCCGGVWKQRVLFGGAFSCNLTRMRIFCSRAFLSKLLIGGVVTVVVQWPIKYEITRGQ